MSVTNIVSPGTYYAVCDKERGYIMSFPQDRMGQATPHMIFMDEGEAKRAMQDAKNWCSADLKLRKLVVSCEDL